MDLREALTQDESPDARRTRAPHNEANFDPETGRVKDIGVSFKGIPATEEAHRAEIKRVMKLDIPEDREVVLTSTRWWGRTLEDGSMENVYCRFDIRDRVHVPDDVDPVALLRDLRRGARRSKAKPRTGEGALVVSWNDWQVGLIEGGGTPAFLERLDSAFDGITDRAKELERINRSFGHLVIIGGGDMIEGCAMRPNHAFELDLDRRDQIRVTTTGILEGLDRLAPRFQRVTVLVVGGNHGENRIDHKRTTRSDNDDCAVFEHAALAASRDARLSHVEFKIAQGEVAKTVEVAGWILGTTHGHAYGKTMSGSVEQKAYKWFSQQAAGRHPVGDSDVLVTHHFHHYAARDWGACQWVQTPALDGGSRWVTDMNGMYSDPGMMSFVMTPDKRMQDVQVIQ